MGVLDGELDIESKSDLVIEYDLILKFVKNYVNAGEYWDREIPIYPDFEDGKEHSGSATWFSLNTNDILSGPGPTSHTVHFSNIYLVPINNHYIIIPYCPSLPVAIINYYGDILPEYIRFANGTSVCRIMTQGNSANYGYSDIQ